MQRICAVCGCAIDRNESHFENHEQHAFYCFKCGNRRLARACDPVGFGITLVMFALFILFILLLVWAAIAAMF